MKYFIMFLFPSILLAQKQQSCVDSIIYQINEIISTNSPKPMFKYSSSIEENPKVYFECGALLLEDNFEKCNYDKVESILYFLWITKKQAFSKKKVFFDIANSLLISLDTNNRQESWLIGFVLTLYNREKYYTGLSVETSFKLLQKGNIFSRGYHPWFDYLLWVGEQEEHQDVLIQLESTLVKNDFYGNSIYRHYEKILKEKVRAIKNKKK